MGIRKDVPEWFGSFSSVEFEDNLHEELEVDVRKSIEGGREGRIKRLEMSEKRPLVIQVISRAFKRNPDVVAEVLFRASGHCESCGMEAPFNRAKDGSPYLEVHHKIMLSDGGDDTVENAVALCPNCHREKHFGIR